jgi:dihydrofolate reductase
MQDLAAFTHISLDGYFAGPGGDIGWAHRDDAESRAFAAENAGGGGELLFGRITYEMMASYWRTPMASANDPVVARAMNDLPKVVFSRTLDKASWSNTRLVKGDLVTEVRKLKQQPGRGMVILGSGSIVARLAGAGLIDEYQIMITPVVLGAGRTLFAGIGRQLDLKLTRTRTFGNGNVVLCYEPDA